MGSEEDSRILLADLSGSELQDLLPQLAAHPNSQVRGWAIWAAAEGLGKNGISVLTYALDDADPDVRDDALTKLVQIDKSAARAQLSRVRGKLRSSDDFEVASAMWVLAELRDTDSLPVLEEMSDSPRTPWLAKVASVAALVLSGNAQEIQDRIRRHDHATMRELAHGAILLRNDAGRRVLEEVIESPTMDPTCIAWAKWFLDWGESRSVATNRPRHDGPAVTR